MAVPTRAGLRALRSLSNCTGPSHAPIFNRSFSSFAARQAVAHKTTGWGPAPDPPTPRENERTNISRRRKRVDLSRTEVPTSSDGTKPQLTKRFWKEAKVEEGKGEKHLPQQQLTDPDGLTIVLDKRPLKTPTKATLIIPRNKHQLAIATALEWEVLENAQQALKPHMIPLTSIASRALALEEEDANGHTGMRDEIVRTVMRYLDTDAVLCLAPKSDYEAEENKKSLRDLQIESGKAIIDHLTSTIWPGVEIAFVQGESIIPTEQAPLTKEIIRGWVAGLGAYELVGLERAVLATKSLLVAARLVSAWSPSFRDSQPESALFGVEDATAASTLEVKWQTDRWGTLEYAHDIENEDIRRQLGSVVLLVATDSV